MSYELTGRLIEIGQTQQVSDRFQKREFVIETKSPGKEGKEYIDYIKMQLSQTKCDIIDRYKIGDSVKVQFNVKGKRFEKDGKVMYFNAIEAWRIEYDQQQVHNYQGNTNGNWNG